MWVSLKVVPVRGCDAHLSASLTSLVYPFSHSESKTLKSLFLIAIFMTDLTTNSGIEFLFPVLFIIYELLSSIYRFYGLLCLGSISGEQFQIQKAPFLRHPNL